MKKHTVELTTAEIALLECAVNAYTRKIREEHDTTEYESVRKLDKRKIQLLEELFDKLCEC